MAVSDADSATFTKTVDLDWFQTAYSGDKTEYNPDTYRRHVEVSGGGETT